MRLFNKLLEEHSFEDFLEFATFMYWSKNYSMYNSALIMLQRPGVSHVETEEKWLSKYSRNLLPEASPIVILVPFGPVNFVYDIEDTFGDYSPTEMKEFQKAYNSKTPVMSLDTLKKLVYSFGIYYGEKPFGSRQCGEAKFLEKQYNLAVNDKKGKTKIIKTRHAIIVNSRMDDVKKATTILHEIGHIMCGHLSQDKDNELLKVVSRKDVGLSREQQEYEAEKVCEMICSLLGCEYSNNEYLGMYLIDGKVPEIDLEVVIKAVDKFREKL